MNIIVVSGKLAQARTITLTRTQIVTLFALLVILGMAAASAIAYFAVRHASALAPLLGMQATDQGTSGGQEAQAYMQETIHALAVRMGQMQAQLLRLDGLGERLAQLAGIKPQEFSFDQPPGRGGAITHLPQHTLSVGQLADQLNELTRLLSHRSDQLHILESVLLESQLVRQLVPSMRPVDGGWLSSGFGWRIDPFTGQRAIHEGVDFVAPVGTPILAAAGGVVVTSEHHPEYGNMIEIDHGNNLVTRYAHASKRLVEVGAIVLRGQKIGEVGNTGRSTGPHLHFEVRRNGVALNPARFLKAQG
ncbi:M23 family metallopeptidase [Pelomicrobium sp. G1]|uniref:M23 family metallopeptidase n=1 Tax=unclassified Pelomicrobium TaxID=2815318 RepID=UPI003F76F918